MNQEDKTEDHVFILRVPKPVWDNFVETLSMSDSANKKINQLIFNYLMEYENAVGEFSAEKNRKNKNRK